MRQNLKTAPHRRPHVVIAGAGVGAVESALALRALLGDVVAIDLVAPDTEFAYRAMSVAEPFGYAPALRVPLSRLVASHALHHHQDRLASVDTDKRQVYLEGGAALPYEALIVALGARPREWMPGALTFGTAGCVDAMRNLLERLENDEVADVAFVAPPGASWTLPLYELALMTATWCGERHLHDVTLTIHTDERDPLSVFGPAATRVVRDLLVDRGVRLLHGLPEGADAVVTLPALEGNPIEGLPADADGFIPVGEFGSVPGAPGVYAVGDATTAPVKQGGLAAQQADAAAADIAHGLGAAVDPHPAPSVVRGLLLTGVTSAYLTAAEEGESSASFEALWWPPTKVAGHYLGPWLADMHDIGRPAEMTDRPPPEDAAQAARDRSEIRRLAIEMAEADAGWGDHRSALRWLQTVEWLDGVLPEDLAKRRREWETALR